MGPSTLSKELVRQRQPQPASADCGGHDRVCISVRPLCCNETSEAACQTKASAASSLRLSVTTISTIGLHSRGRLVSFSPTRSPCIMPLPYPSHVNLKIKKL